MTKKKQRVFNINKEKIDLAERSAKENENPKPAWNISTSNVTIKREGYSRLWRWFSLSYASWLTLPRVMMHEMPDEWQDKMAALLEEWDRTWDSNSMPTPTVNAKKDGKYTRWPGWLLDYRHPNKQEITKLKIKGD